MNQRIAMLILIPVMMLLTIPAIAEVPTWRYTFNDGSQMNLPVGVPEDVWTWVPAMFPMPITDYAGVFGLLSPDGTTIFELYFDLATGDDTLGVVMSSKDAEGNVTHTCWIAVNPKLGEESYIRASVQAFKYMIDSYKGPPKQS